MCVMHRTSLERYTRNRASETELGGKGLQREGGHNSVNWLSQDLTHNYIIRIVMSTHSAYYVLGMF